MKKQIDVGLEFIQRIHFKRRSGEYAVYDELVRLYGKDKAEEFFKAWDDSDSGANEFYELKNQNIDISTVISECYDADIIRQFCNYLYDHKEYIRGDVLDIGCESGYMTAFLAMYFPEIHITAIDRSENAIRIARERLERLGITNVDCRVADVHDVREQYDTVISMRTLMENIATDVINYDIFQGADLEYQFARNKEETRAYADTLIHLLRDGGRLISIERLPRSPLAYGWVSALNASGCAYMQDSFKYIFCKEADTTGRFTAFVAEKGVRIEDEDIEQFVIDDFLNASDDDNGWQSATACKGWTAIAYFDRHKGEFIRDHFIIENSDDYNGPVGRFAAYYDKDDANKILYLRLYNSFKAATLDILDASLRDRVADDIEVRTAREEQGGFSRASKWPE